MTKKNSMQRLQTGPSLRTGQARNNQKARFVGPAGATIAAVALTFAPAVSAQDYTSAGSATFSDSTPAAGENITITGRTTPDTLVVVTIQQTSSGSITNGSIANWAAAFAKTTLASTTSDGDGDYSLSFVVPANATSGSFVLEVSAGDQVLASTVINVGPTDSATTPAQVDPGTTATLPVTGGSTLIMVTAAGAMIVAGGLSLTVARRNQTTA